MHRRAHVLLLALFLLLISVLTTESAGAGTRTVSDVAAGSGLFEFSKSWSAAEIDADADGDLDLWVGDHQKGGRLWSSNGDGTYTRVAPDAWPAGTPQTATDRHDCAWADVDGNGLPDAYCSAGRNKGNFVKPASRDNELWLQQSAGSFVEVGTAWGVGDPCGRGRHVAFLDVNADGWPDLFVGNETGRTVVDPCDDPAAGYPSEDGKLFLNDHGTGFVLAQDFGVDDPGQRCAVTFDADGDGDTDLLGCRLRNRSPQLFRNDGTGTLTSVSTGLVKPASDAVAADLDGDGDQDLVLAGSTSFFVQLNDGSGHFSPPRTILSVPPGAQGRSVAVGDADGDGLLDVYALVAGPTAATNPDDVLLLSTGPMSWSPTAVPSASGQGDEVTAVHSFGAQGPVRFLVQNGGNGGEAGVGGPVQLIAVTTNP